MNNVIEVIKVGIADLNICQAPQTISTSGLGSCVGLVIYDDFKKIAGLVHVMLPSSSLSRTPNFKPGKFADSGIKELLKLMEDHGTAKHRLKAKMAGGAQMFNIQSNNQMLRIGVRNVEAIKKILDDYRIPIISEDVGGDKGRTVEFFPETSQFKIRTVHEGVKFI
ncbi:chemotaxis protein CheD [Bacillaceae bacterium W0354]